MKLEPFVFRYAKNIYPYKILQSELTYYCENNQDQSLFNSTEHLLEFHTDV